MGKTVTDRPKTDNQGQIERGRQSQADRGRETGRETAADSQTDRQTDRGRETGADHHRQTDR